MSNGPDGANEQSVAVEHLIAEFMQRSQAGESLDIEQFISAHPEHAAELKQHFANIDPQESTKGTESSVHEETILAPNDHSEEAIANTLVPGTADSDTSITRQYEGQSTSSVTSLEIPETFGRYAIRKVLGQGAMGAVYLARDTQLDRDVALKIPKFGDGNGVDDQELLERFYREARASATLRSPNICPVYDVGDIDGQHYITMAYIEGRPLKDYTKSKKKHSEKQIITTIRKLAVGLEQAHKIGVIHRDLKPANIMVDQQGEPVVMDFGLARRSSSDDVQVTQSGAILGTPAYMSPEQVEGDQAAIGPQTDIYALGVIMYELLTGEMPFKGGMITMLSQIAANNPTRPLEVRPDLDPRLEKICLKMMAGDLSKRYQSMAEVAKDLQKVLRQPNPEQKQNTAKKTGPKLTSLPGANEESNPALITVEQPKSYADQLRKKKRKTRGKSSQSSSSPKSAKAGKFFSSHKKLLVGGGLGALLLLLAIVFLVRGEKYDVQITLDDPSMSLKVDGDTVDNGSPLQLSAGPHELSVELAGLAAETGEFTVRKDGKNVVHVAILDGKLAINPSEAAVTAANSVANNTKPVQDATHETPGTITRSSSTTNAPPPAVTPFDEAQAKAHQQAWADYLGVPIEYENSIGMKFRLLPPGEFLMGSTADEIKAAEKYVSGDQKLKESLSSEAPQHKVILTNPIYVSETEVTQAHYEQVMGTNPSHFSATGEGKDAVAGLDTSNFPVDAVSWRDAVDFCAKLSQQEKMKPFYFRSGVTVKPLDGTGYRLPTEAEWEYACRAGTTTRFWSGDEHQDLITAGWFNGNSNEHTHAVGKLKANPFGLYDMHGNVREWVQDSWGPSFYEKFKDDAAVNPSNPFNTNSDQVFRGGNWERSWSGCRAAGRYPAHPAASSKFGFRVVLPVEAVKRAPN